MAVLGCLTCMLSPILRNQIPPSNSNNSHLLTRRKALTFTTSIAAFYFHFCQNSDISGFSPAIAQQVDELQQEEDRDVQLFQVPKLLVKYIWIYYTIIDLGQFHYIIVNLFSFCFLIVMIVLIMEYTWRWIWSIWYKIIKELSSSNWKPNMYRLFKVFLNVCYSENGKNIWFYFWSF